MSRRIGSVMVLLLVSAGCGGAGGSAPQSAEASAAAFDVPTLLVVGTAQDGGLPHAGCACPRCERARGDASSARLIASVAIVLPTPPRIYLIDATPDVRPQLDRLAAVSGRPADRVDRSPVDGVFLTHAHLGHYTGLAFFGFEAIHTRDLPVYCTPSMAAFLESNGPWSQLVELGNVELQRLSPGETIELDRSVNVRALSVPHRDEYADTVGYVIAGPTRTVLYVPDTDSWAAWNPPLLDELDRIDIAILDGTFYSMDELPGRDIDSIGHPLITQSMDLLQHAVDTNRLTVYFSHLNHSNPAVESETPQRKEIGRRGFRVLEDGQSIPL